MQAHIFTRPAKRHRRVALQGQSNCYGVGAISEIAALSDPMLAGFAAAPFSRVYIWVNNSAAYQPLEIGVNNQSIANCIGPEFGLAVRWQRETSAGNLYIDKQYGDGQPISYFQRGGSFYTQNLARHAAGTAWLTANGISEIQVKGYLWTQGESDAAASQATYQAALENLFNARLEDGLLLPTAKRLLVQMKTGTTYYGAGVVAAKDAYVAAHPGVASGYTMPPYFNGDNTHLNARGQANHGYAAYSAIFGAAALTV